MTDCGKSWILAHHQIYRTAGLQRAAVNPFRRDRSRRGDRIRGRHSRLRHNRANPQNRHPDSVSLRQPLRQALQTASRLGADGVEIDARTELPPGELSQTGLRQFRKLLGDLGLGVSAVSFITRRGYDTPDDLERRVLATQAAMKFAQTLGANVVINRVGRVPDDENDPRFAALVEVLSGLGAYGDRVGARLAAQTGSESGPQLARLFAALPDQTVGVDLHPSGLIHHGHDPAEAVAAVGRHVIHVHACDAVRDLVQRPGDRRRTRPRHRRLARTLGPTRRIQLPRLGHDRTPERGRPGRRNRQRGGVSAVAVMPAEAIDRFLEIAPSGEPFPI